MGPLGVYAAGTSGDQTGSLGWTYAGTLGGLGVGALVGLPLLAGSAETNSGGMRLLGAVVFVGAQVAGPVVGFNLSREYDPGARRPAAATPGSEGQQLPARGAPQTGVRFVPVVNVTQELAGVGAAGEF